MTLGVHCTVAGSRFGPGCRPSVSPSASVAPLAPRRSTTGQGAGPLALAAPHRAAPAGGDGALPAPRGRTAASFHCLDGVRRGHAGGAGAAKSAAQRRPDRTAVTTSRTEPRASPCPAGRTSAVTTSLGTARRGRATGARHAHAHAHAQPSPSRSPRRRPPQMRRCRSQSRRHSPWWCRGRRCLVHRRR